MYQCQLNQSPAGQVTVPGLIKTDQLVTIYIMQLMSKKLNHWDIKKNENIMFALISSWEVSNFHISMKLHCQGAILKQHRTRLSKQNVKPVFIYIKLG